MSRDQRIHNNRALLFAQEMAFKYNSELKFIFCVDINFPGSNYRHFKFMIDGLKQLAVESAKFLIPFEILEGKPTEQLLSFINKNEMGALICDFDPILIKQMWKNELNTKLKIPFIEVDAHNIVPCRIASIKQEFGAYTL